MMILLARSLINLFGIGGVAHFIEGQGASKISAYKQEDEWFAIVLRPEIE